MGIQVHFNKFHNRIKLGREDDLYKKARKRDNSIKREVISEFSVAGYPVVSDFIQGSFKTHTGIVPISGDYDIDRAIVINEDRAPKNPVTPKKKVLDVLENRGFKDAKIKKPCVTADYVSDNVHIDFIIYKQRYQQLYLAVGKENSDEFNRKWSISDPHGLTDWINGGTGYFDSNSLTQFRRLVRYLKRWRDIQFSQSIAAKVFSIGLTVMVKEQFSWSFSTEGEAQDLQALIDTVDNILNANYFIEEEFRRYRIRVMLPVSPYRDIFHGSSLDTGTQLRNKLSRLKDKLVEVKGLSDVTKQCEILNGLFGADFKVPDPPSGRKKVAAAIYPSAGIVTSSTGA